MSDREKEIAIAQKLGYEVRLRGIYYGLKRPDGSQITGLALKSSDYIWQHYAPLYFTDRNANAEIVEYFAKQSKGTQALFYVELLPSQEDQARTNSDIMLGLLATPRQICEAALAVWGIEQGGEAK